MFKNIYYKILVWTSYQIGDILSNFEYEWSYNLYQKCMSFSLDCDEEIDFWWWKEPPLNDDEDEDL
jgi:hypothetical protein